MKKLLTLIAIILALTLALASCGFLSPTPDGNGNNTDDGGNTEDSGNTEDGGNTENGGNTDDGGNIEGGENTEHTHEFGEWTTTAEPTCTEQGVSERTCACGERETELVSATGHNMVDDVCSICGTIKYSEGLEFTSNGDGTCCVSGIGTCTDTDLVIPPISPSGDSVTSIAYLAFNECTSLTSAVIPDSVIDIGYSAFKDCTSLVSAVIPDSVTFIGYGVFDGCASLKNVTISKNIVFMSNHTFYNCTSLTRVEIPEGVTDIGAGAFRGCTSLTSVHIPNSVTTIDSMAFYNCASLTEIEIPDSVTYIGNHVFCDCASLTSVAIPEGVTTISGSTFSGCTSLTSVEIPDSITTIDNMAFSYCTSLTEIEIPKSVTVISNYAFSYCTSLTDVYYTGTEEEWAAISIGDGNDALTGANIHYNKCPEYPLELLDGSGSVSVSDFIGKKVVVNFWGTWCGPCKSELPDFDKIASEFSGEVVILAVHSVLDIDDASDYVSSNFPDSKIIFAKDTSINAYTDRYFTMLGGTSYYPHTVILDEAGSITYMQDGAMSYDELKEHLGVESVKYSEGLEFVSNGDGTCYIKGIGTCTDTDIVIPPVSPENDAVTAIGSYSLRGSSITSVLVPDGVTSIGDYAFYRCYSLESINIPSGVTYIGEGAFQSCTSLKGIDIPEGVTTIGEYAFYHCPLFTSVDIPGSVTEIGYYAFSNCTALASINVADGNTAYKDIDGNLYTYDGTMLMQYAIAKTDTEFAIPEGVTKLAGNSFGWCTSLKSVTIPGSVTGLHYAVFIGCSSLTSVTFGEGIKLTSIGDSAFYGCDMLTDVYYAGTEEEWNSINILPANDCLKNATIHYEYGKE